MPGIHGRYEIEYFENEVYWTKEFVTERGRREIFLNPVEYGFVSYPAHEISE